MKQNKIVAHCYIGFLAYRNNFYNEAVVIKVLYFTDTSRPKVGPKSKHFLGVPWTPGKAYGPFLETVFQIK